MFQSDPSHSGLGVVGLGPNYAYAWNYTTGNIIESSPAVVGGYLYIGSADDNFYCLNASTGGLIWKYPTGSNIYLSLPAFAGGLVYIGSYDDNLYCLKCNLRYLYVELSYRKSRLVGSPTVVGGIFVFWVNYYYLYCLNATTGGLIWKYNTNSSINQASPV